MTGSGKIFLLLGSNLGDRAAILQQARQMISENAGTILSQSSIYETEPWGLLDQPAFLNQVIEIDSAEEPESLLKILLQTEQEIGRIRKIRWGARLIDIDILYYKDLVQDSSALILPHPHLHERKFTLIPLAEIAPEFLDPKSGKTVAQLLAACSDHSIVAKIS
ncbi:2-amino-4-hydroxy-6-hydroxymethyldihydropteridine diphosphokinase [Dyadobacter aurulentus]|uniref:2-amino-4-hydroxy-6- hydroxymethyldihydropteridine diphosphokinase n=1 Tax=Dyadobacter sp. UC 10 TaxID=2605428 RepID=UPI0011F0C4AF|nr:2-amino-4-hydroxy-6-hydroxymethyldihydropteridine diphosphokinase [Dyadobacter sp. UC 10]KAA0990701.1 2-amino-4-hydroxy-6-hydroxymethyldihydropteridine diphosphokinase [Dyadobacter sp. UC 10]